MTDRPIIFSAPMIRALLAGTKTQTRMRANGADVMNPIERLARKIEHRKLLVRFQIIGTLRARGVWRRHQRRCLQEDIDNLREAYAKYSAACCIVFTPAAWEARV